MAYTYATNIVPSEASATTAQQAGLGTANNIMQGKLNTPNYYPEDVSKKMEGPASMNLSENIGYNPMQTIQGIGQNGYQDLQNALQAPILQQGQQAQQAIADVYGGRGLYGSVGGGLMSGAQAGSQQATQNALANAVAQRYDLQLQDQAQQLDQNKALFSSGAATSDQQNAFNQLLAQINQQNSQQGIDFRNTQKQAGSQYELNKQNWQTGIDELNFQRALQLAGQGNSGAQVQASLTNASNMADAQQQAALYSGIGSIAGGLMGSYDGSGDSGWNFGDLKFW